MIEELRYKCPNCGSEKRICQEIVDEDKKAGWIGETIKIGIWNKVEVPITDPKATPFPGKPLSVVTKFEDMCYDCGQTYTFMVRRREEKWSLDISKLFHFPEDPNLPPGFGKNS